VIPIGPRILKENSFHRPSHRFVLIGELRFSAHLLASWATEATVTVAAHVALFVVPAWYMIASVIIP